MKSPGIWIAAAVSLVVAVGGLSTSARGEPGNAVTEWNLFAASTLGAFPGPAGGASPALLINEARFDPAASKEAAVATATYRVLSDIISTVPASISFPNRASLLQAVATRYVTYLAAIPDSPSKTEGIAAGNAAADTMIAARQGDGRFGPSLWVPNPDPGHWWPLSNPDGTPMLDPTPWVGGVRPFLIESSSQFRTDGPQDLASAAWAEDFNEVKALGSINSTVRTPEQTHIALFWQSPVPQTWNAVARNLADDPTYEVDLADSALLFAMLNLTTADAAINCWNDKYYWDFWRPWDAIPRAGEDGNEATEPDPSWRALLTAPYPEHPSGHLCFDSASLRVLEMFFGTDKIRFGVTSVRFPGETRYYDRFSDALKEIVDARVWAGLHYRTADVQAVGLGKKVAHYMSKHFFQPLD
jgi:hypothetical protein